MTSLRPSTPVCRWLLPSIVVGRWLGIALTLLLSAAAAVEAQEPTGQPAMLSATEFLAKVERSNPRLELLEGAVDLEAADATAAGLWSNPILAFDREEIFGETRSFPENILRLELTVEISGRRGLRVDAAELGVRAARNTADQDKRRILLDSLGVYLRAAASRLKLEVLLQQRVALGRLVQAVKSRTTAGDASGYDLDRLAIESEALSDLVSDAERELLSYRRALGLLAGDPKASFDAGDALLLPIPPPGSGPPTLDSNPMYRSAGWRAQQAELELRAAGRGWVPVLGLSGGAKSAVLDTDTRWGYVAGLSLSLPFLDYGQADAGRARARLRSARAQQQLVQQQLLVEGDLASDGLVRAVDQARRFEGSQLPRLERLVGRAELTYQEGEHPVFELLDAYRTARGVRLRAIDLKLQARLAELELWRARGLGPGGNP